MRLTQILDKTGPGQSRADISLRMAGISKSFSGVRVLEGVDFDVMPREVHVLAGENGAGKSTLMKILSGIHTEYQGRILLNGKRTRFRCAADAAVHGIAMIHQEMSLVPSMNVVDNMFLGREKARSGVWVDRRAQRRTARDVLGQLGISVDLERPVEAYPVSVQQMVEITKALTFRARIIIMDEPTSALNQPEVERLFRIITDLKRHGCGIVYISHRMEEIYRVADRVTVLRDGKRVGTAPKENLPGRELVRWMVGRELKQQFPRRAHVPGPDRLVVEGLSLRDPSGYRDYLVKNVSLSVGAGEVVGVAGLEGAGNHELLHGLFGAYGTEVHGRIIIDGQPFRLKNPAHSISKGLALLTNDRKSDGLVLDMSVVHNTTLASLARFSPRGWLRPAMENEASSGISSTMNVKLISLNQPVRELSGGNQQKVALGKWLVTGPKILLLDEPTRGVDVGSKKEIYSLMNSWTQRDMAILLITSEMPELLAMSDRIVVMHRGSVTAELSKELATQENVVQAAMGKSADG